jgi:hypothetical protein
MSAEALGTRLNAFERPPELGTMMETGKLQQKDEDATKIYNSF